MGIEVEALDWILKEIHGLIGLEYQSISMIGPRGLCGLRDAYFPMGQRVNITLKKIRKNKR